jgi:hypothetical protein
MAQKMRTFNREFSFHVCEIIEEFQKKLCHIQNVSIFSKEIHALKEKLKQLFIAM